MDITEIRCPNCQENDIVRHTAYETKNNGERFDVPADSSGS
ncbi:hypothetical protein [Desulfonema magnum]|uniref:Uncharacterized protein n=1 Tax=Desulfonema magnum TaxID=45655 RepID=A0A975BTL9_9BACT|nr:hypothetical protein [Desulfonema magnum]QTA91014.1 Uncharacterized protein dnm_070780 [Desulfonema magnum]